jgi:hypothetical protein
MASARSLALDLRNSFSGCGNSEIKAGRVELNTTEIPEPHPYGGLTEKEGQSLRDRQNR